MESGKCRLDPRASASAFDFARFRSWRAIRRPPDYRSRFRRPIPEQPEAAIATVKDQDGFNWGYDPYHYGNTGGELFDESRRDNTDPRVPRDGRVASFDRAQGGNGRGLQSHRQPRGRTHFRSSIRWCPDTITGSTAMANVYTNTCGPDTASEHRMFFKLMLDTLKMWAKEYQVDGFRFDLMSFSFKDNMLEIKKALHEIDPTIYLYGEGWDFGEVANNALGENATQANMAGQGSVPSATEAGMRSAGEERSIVVSLWSLVKGLSTDSGTTVTALAAPLYNSSLIRATWSSWLWLERLRITGWWIVMAPKSKGPALLQRQTCGLCLGSNGCDQLHRGARQPDAL